jgi:ribosomal protein L24E
MSSVFSTPEQLSRLADILSKYIRLPFSEDTIPGAVLEGTLAHVRNAVVLKTYDFVDVVKLDSRIGWQVKSTKSTTPVTWKRAKIPNQEQLILASRQSEQALQNLGDLIIEFCNAHARESLLHYNLDEIGYSRLVVFKDGNVLYFERLLCTRNAPNIFNPSDFEWRWSIQKQTKKKEQLSALHGRHKPTDTKWFAWHGLGENQLHFYGDSTWWMLGNNPQAVTFKFPTSDERIDLESFISLLEKLKVST